MPELLSSTEDTRLLPSGYQEAEQQVKTALEAFLSAYAIEGKRWGGDDTELGKALRDFTEGIQLAVDASVAVMSNGIADVTNLTDGLRKIGSVDGMITTRR